MWQPRYYDTLERGRADTTSSNQTNKNMTAHIFTPSFWHSIIFYGKVAGGLASIGTLLGLFHKYIVMPSFRKVVHINDVLTKFDTNCLPTMQRSLDNQDVVLGDLITGHKELKDQVATFTVRQNVVEKAVGTMHTSLLNHLENVSREKRKSKVKV